MIGLLIIIIFPFMFFYIQINNFNKSTIVIKDAVNKKADIYINPITNKIHWTENGEQVIWTKINEFERIPEGCVVDDKVLLGVKTGHIYINKSLNQFKEHVHRQIKNNKCWCYERSTYNKKEINDNDLRYHLKDKYFYYLGWNWDTRSYYICHNKTKIKKYISFEEYKKLGGSDIKDKT